MATTCAIIKQRDDGLWYESSVRSDGYLSGVGALLWKWYQDPARVDRLIDCGWVSPLEPLLEYHEQEKADKDPEELNEDIQKHPDRTSAIMSGLMHGYVYVYEDGKWWYGYGLDDDYDRSTGTFKKLPVLREITREMLLTDEDWPSSAEYLDDMTVPKPFWIETEEQWQKAAAENTNPNVQYFGGNGMFGVQCTSPALPVPLAPLAPEQRDADRYEKYVEHIKAARAELSGISTDITQLRGWPQTPRADAAQKYAIEQFGFSNTPEARAYLADPASAAVDLESVEALKAIPETALASLVPTFAHRLVESQ